MTRVLSDALQAVEPEFRLGLRSLESARGNPNSDIRLTSELLQDSRSKLYELGLDPEDTTPEELYHVLQERIKADDARLVKTLRTKAATFVSAEGNLVDGMVHSLRALAKGQNCLALKNSSLRSLIKRLPPKKTLKRLGYRSLDSFIKHETPHSALTAAWLFEGEAWQRRFREQYKQLQPGDFESRPLTIGAVDFKRWQALAAPAVADKKHNILSFNELGVVVIMPFPDHVPEGAVTASLALALHALNEIRAASTFLKLSQVRGDFGSLVQLVASGEPELDANLLNQPVSWSLIQRYYAELGEHFREALFEPHIQLEDMAWHPIEHAMLAIEPSLGFWEHSAHLGLLEHAKPVSFNIVDAALNYCNKLPFEQRIVHYFQRSLWHELLLRYMQAETVEQSVMQQLQPEMAGA